jgi:hypothetical protein
MYSRRKSFYWLLAFLVLAIVWAFSVPPFVHRRDFDKAFTAWQKNPTPKNEAALRAGGRKNQQIQLRDSTITALVLAGLGLSVYGGVEFASKHKKRAKPHVA